MGSFRVAERNAASSRQVQFHWVNLGDSEEVVIPFMQDGTYPPRNFATLGPSELQPPFIWNWILRVNAKLSWTDTGQVSDPILHLLILQSPVFLLNSRFFHFHDPIKTLIFIQNLNLKVLLFPKLQSQFAEFLQDCYLNRLSFFNLSTCVGFQYGTQFFFSNLIFDFYPI